MSFTRIDRFGGHAATHLIPTGKSIGRSAARCNSGTGNRRNFVAVGCAGSGAGNAHRHLTFLIPRDGDGAIIEHHIGAGVGAHGHMVGTPRQAGDHLTGGGLSLPQLPFNGAMAAQGCRDKDGGDTIIARGA